MPTNEISDSHTVDSGGQGKWVLFFLYVVLLASNFYLLHQLRMERRTGFELQVALQEQYQATVRSELDRRGFESVLTSLTFDGDFMVGYEVRGDSLVAVSGEGPTIVYVLDTLCPACDINLDQLVELAGRPDLAVVAISFNDDQGSLAEYALSREIPFPVLASPSGPGAQALPRHGTPITAFVEGRRIHAFLSGPIDAGATSWW